MVWCVRIFGLDRCQSEPLKMPEEKPHIYNSEASSIKKYKYISVCVYIGGEDGLVVEGLCRHMWYGRRCVCVVELFIVLL